MLREQRAGGGECGCVSSAGGAGGKCSAVVEVFVDYVLRGVIHALVLYRANRANGANGHFCLQR